MGLDGMAARATTATLAAAASGMSSWLLTERFVKGSCTGIGAAIGPPEGSNFAQKTWHL